MFKLALFDFDGVLVESLPIYEETVTECLRRIGSPIVQSREDFLSLFDGNFYEELASRGVDLTRFAQAADPILRAVDIGRIIPKRDVLAIVEQVKSNNIIISSNSAEAIEAVFSRWGIKNFHADLLGSEFRYSKKEKIAHAMKKFGASKKETAYIGDTVGDIKEACEAGVIAVAVAWGWHNRERLIKANPDFMADTPEELLNILNGASATPHKK